jgi:ribose-phosphate pyrophosphokinase
VSVVLACPGNERMADMLADRLGAVRGGAEFHRFPDGETLVRLGANVRGDDAVVVATLNRPNERFIELAFLAETAREYGAERVGLVAPYLAYMRQDVPFRPGEGVTSRYFAAILSRTVDWLVTVDPHLHRHRSLGELYTIPARVAHAAPAVAGYVRRHHADGVIIGPDTESKQWVAAVARDAGVPFTVLRKERRGDREVHVSIPDASAVRGRTPVVLDDIISTGSTMSQVAGQLRALGAAAPVCIGIHAVFDAGAERSLRESGIADLVTCNTIEHASNGIDVSEAIAVEVRASLK